MVNANFTQRPCHYIQNKFGVALFLANLMNGAKEWLDFTKDEKCTYWADATIILYWIKQVDPDKWKMFVANRVREIQNLSSPAAWHHVPGLQNPADLLTRSHTLQEIQESETWKVGPSFILTEKWPEQPDFNTAPKEAAEEIKSNKWEETFSNLSNTAEADEMDESNWDIVRKLTEKNSSIYKVIRILARICRLWAKWKNQINPSFKPSPFQGRLLESPAELNGCMDILARHMQKTVFSRELSFIRKGEKLPGISTIAKLKPFLDEAGLLRVQGRLASAGPELNWSYDYTHPIILPSTHEVLGRIILWFHQRNCHSGTDQTRALLGQRFWILKEKKTVTKYLARCVDCKKADGKKLQPPTAELPPERIDIQVPPFTHAAIDAMGPIIIKSSLKPNMADVTEEDQPTPNTPDMKVWILVITCMTTRAVSMEILENLAVESFIGAMRRHIADHGRPATVRLDNFKTHVAMQGEIDKLLSKSFEQDVNGQAVKLGIK